MSTMPLAVIFGLSLSMDALAVSCAIPLCVAHISVVRSLKVAMSFALFQAFMPLAGWMAAKRFYFLIEPVDHWVGLLLLSAVGIKMIREGLEARKGCPVMSGDPTKGRVLLALSVGTSIDALAVGVSFTGMKVQVISTVFIIGLITFLLSFAGLRLSGKLCGNDRTGKMEILAGTVLILLGIKMVLDHLGILQIY